MYVCLLLTLYAIAVWPKQMNNTLYILTDIMQELDFFLRVNSNKMSVLGNVAFAVMLCTRVIRQGIVDHLDAGS